MANYSANGEFGFGPMQRKDCFFFVHYGMCSYGHNCKYNHPSAPDNSVVVHDGMSENMYADYTRKIPCKFFRAGFCMYGSKCDFNHSVPDPSLQYNSDGLPMQMVVREGFTANMYADYTRKIPCKFFYAGFCMYGSNCEFNHSMPDAPLQYNSDGLPMRMGEELCSFYMHNRWCGYGKDCKFHHPELYIVPPEYGPHALGQAQEYDDQDQAMDDTIE